MAPREVVETPIYTLTACRHTAWLPWNIYIRFYTTGIEPVLKVLPIKRSVDMCGKSLARRLLLTRPPCALVSPEKGLPQALGKQANIHFYDQNSSYNIYILV